MLRIVCVKSGTLYGPEYVNILHDMVRRNLPSGLEGTFTCFTDDATGLDEGIEFRPLPEGFRGWWHKLWLFRNNHFDNGDRILYLDLDTVITGRLDEIAAYDGPFAILRDFYRPEGLQSSIMAWSANTLGFLWTDWLRADAPELPGGDQEWIEREVEAMGLEYDLWQEKYPDSFVSYKVSRGTIPDKASVVVFHGHPRPSEVLTGWVPQVWKVGGLTRAELDTICNTEQDRLFANVRSSIKRDLPWFDLVAQHDRHAVIVGGGPSLAEKVEAIRWRAGIGQEIWALNGSADWLVEHGITPDVQVIADARPENVKFVANRQWVAKHLIASQCAPVIFDALSAYAVTLWHSAAPGIEKLFEDDYGKPVHLIGGGSTVGLSAIVLAHASGYRKIHLYGFDSSYRDDGHHAYEQAANDADLVVDVLFGDRKFKAAPWMVQQAKEFCALAASLAEDGTIITVAGDGLLPAMAYDISRTGLITAADIRVAAVLKRLNSLDKLVGAEIGVFEGSMSAALLRSMPNLTLYMIDWWAGEGQGYHHGSSGDDWHAKLSQDDQDGFYVAAMRSVAFAGARAGIIRKPSIEAARDIPDGSLDFVFIDADHSYEGCSADIEGWLPKLKSGGLLSGHDYANEEYPDFGVTQAVSEFVARTGYDLELDENFTWFVRLPIKAQAAA